MELENLTKALHSACFAASEIREALADAVLARDRFAVLALYDLIEPAQKLEAKLQRLVNAASEE